MLESDKSPEELASSISIAETDEIITTPTKRTAKSNAVSLIEILSPHIIKIIRIIEINV